MGDSHAIYNASKSPVRWLNFAVSTVKGRGDNFDLSDTRVGATLDPIPVFVSARLEADKLKENTAYAGEGVRYRQLFSPEVFSTDWNNVGHVVIPAGKSTNHNAEGIDEVYYVTKGSGQLKIGASFFDFSTDNAFTIQMGESATITNGGSGDMELMVVSIAPSGQKMRAIEKPLTTQKAMAMQMDFVVDNENGEAFEKMYYSVYVPAMTVHPCYISSN
jgi:mannose-6-phosphate isomerase-like protein (cupin superfamily)